MNFTDMLMQANGHLTKEEVAPVDVTNPAWLAAHAAGMVPGPDMPAKKRKARPSTAKIANKADRYRTPAVLEAREKRIAKRREETIDRYRVAMKGKGEITVKDVAIKLQITPVMTLVFIKKLIGLGLVKLSKQEKTPWSCRPVRFYVWLEP